jgi:hypothetical protein
MVPRRILIHEIILSQIITSHHLGRGRDTNISRLPPAQEEVVWTATPMRINIRGMASQETRAVITAAEPATINTTNHRLAAGISRLTHIMPEVLLAVVGIMITMKNLNINHRKERRLGDRLIMAE